MKLYAVVMLDRETGEMADEPKLTSFERAKNFVQIYKDDKHYKYAMLAINAEAVV